MEQPLIAGKRTYSAVEASEAVPHVPEDAEAMTFAPQAMLASVDKKLSLLLKAQGISVEKEVTQ